MNFIQIDQNIENRSKFYVRPHVKYGSHCIDSLETQNWSYFDIFSIEFNQNQPGNLESTGRTFVYAWK